MHKKWFMGIFLTILIVSGCANVEKPENEKTGAGKNQVNSEGAVTGVSDKQEEAAKSTGQNQKTATVKNGNIVNKSVIVPLGLAKGVGLYDLEKREMIWEKQFGNNNHGIGYVSGKVFLPNMNDTKIEIINVKDGSKEGELQTEVMTHHATQSAKLNEVYIAASDKSILVIDPNTNQLKQKFHLKGAPYYVFTDEKNNFLYVTTSNPNSLEVFNLDTKEPVKSIDLPAKPSHINTLGKQLVVTISDEQKLFLIDIDKLAVTESYNVQDDPHGVGITEDYIVAANVEGKSITVVNRKTKESKNISVGIAANHVEVFDGQFLITDETGPGIYSFEPVTEKLQKVIDTNGPAHQFIVVSEPLSVQKSESELSNVQDFREEDHKAHHGG